MQLSRRQTLKRTGGALPGAALASALHPALGHAATPQRAVSPDLHLLRRTGWGVRAGDLERLGKVGHEAYLEAQLEPQGLPDPLVDAFMAKNRVLSADLETLREAGSTSAWSSSGRTT